MAWPAGHHVRLRSRVPGAACRHGPDERALPGSLGCLLRELNHRTATPYFFKLQEAGRAPGLICSVLQSGLFSLGLQPSPKRRPKGCPAQVLGEPAPCSILLDRPPRSPLLPDNNGFPVPQMLERRQAFETASSSWPGALRARPVPIPLEQLGPPPALPCAEEAPIPHRPQAAEDSRAMRTSDYENFDFQVWGICQANRSALKFITLFGPLPVLVFHSEAWEGA